MKTKDKRFKDLTAIELRMLSWEDVTKMVDVECALEGIPLLPPVPVAPSEVELADRRMPVYEIGGFAFKNIEQAARVLEVIKANQPQGTTYVSGEYVLCAPSEYYLRISDKSVLSAEDGEALKERLALYQNQKKEYDDLLRAYRNINDMRKGTSELIVDAWEFQQAVMRALTQFAHDYARYRELAGDEKVAKTMMREVQVKQLPHLTKAQEYAWNEWAEVNLPTAEASPAQEEVR